MWPLYKFSYLHSLVGGQVYQQSIAAVCIQDWPKDKMLVQVLDDSDELDVQQLIKAEVQKWQQRGVRILYRHRLIRTGYKAGNLKSAMGCDYVKDYEFVAIFDADFQPGPDFLKKTIPHFKVIELNILYKPQDGYFCYIYSLWCREKYQACL